MPKVSGKSGPRQIFSPGGTLNLRHILEIFPFRFFAFNFYHKSEES